MQTIYKILLLFMFVYATIVIGEGVSLALDSDSTLDVQMVEEEPILILEERSPLVTEIVSVEIEEPKHCLYDNEGQMVSGSRVKCVKSESSGGSTSYSPFTGSGNFLFATDDVDAIFWGSYEGRTGALRGSVQWLGSPSVKRVGIGTYVPSSPTSGSMSVLFKDPANPSDPGLLWTGTYGRGRWSISENQTSTQGSLSGVVYRTLR